MANKQFCNRNYHSHTNVHIYLVTKEIISTRTHAHTHTHTYIYNNNFTQDGNTYIQKLNMSSPRGIAQNLRMVASNASLGTRMHGGTTEKEQRRNMEELNRMEVSIKHTGLKLDPVQAKKVASALLENTRCKKVGNGAKWVHKR